MSKKRDKQIRAAQQVPQTGQSLAPNLSVSSQGESPAFCLKYLSGHYCLTKCEQSEQAALAATLHKLCKLTWGDIQQAHRHGAGFETIARHSIKTGIPAAIGEDVRLLAFRFSGKKAMVGFRTGRIFHVVFLDPKFTLYDHGS